MIFFVFTYGLVTQEIMRALDQDIPHLSEPLMQPDSGLKSGSTNTSSQTLLPLNNTFGHSATMG